MADAVYIDPQVETDPDVLLTQAFDDIQAVFPDWQPADANLEVILLATVLRRVAEARELLPQVTQDIFRRFVTDILGIPQRDATYAEVASTWTAADTAGHTIDAGTQVAVAGTAGEQVGFRVLDTVTIAAGAAVTGIGAVILQAVSPGLAGSGLAGPATAIDSLPWLSTIALNGGVTTGGRDTETDDDFRGRTSLRLQVLSEAPILPVDFAILARDIDGVARAVALDGYDPARKKRHQVGVVGATSGNWRYTIAGQQTASIAWDATAAAVQAAVEALPAIGVGNVLVTGGPANTTVFTLEFQGVLVGRDVPQGTVQNVSLGGSPVLGATTTQSVFGQERTVTVAVVDLAGATPPSGTVAAVRSHLAALREVTFAVNVIGPRFKAIDVTWAATTYPGFDPAAVRDAGNAAIAAYLSPASWGIPPYGDVATTGGWLDELLVRRSEVSAALNQVDGLRFVDSLLLNGADADVALIGPAVLTQPGAIAGLVTAG